MKFPMTKYICRECRKEWGEGLCHVFTEHFPSTCLNDGHKVTWERQGEDPRPKMPREE